jgi:hypothetical protein
LLINEYAKAKTVAVTPDPQVNTIFLSLMSVIIDLNLLINIFFFKNSLLFLFMQFLNGRHKEFLIEPDLTFFLGSTSLPSNLSLLLASIILNFAKLIFSSI